MKYRIFLFCLLSISSLFSKESSEAELKKEMSDLSYQEGYQFAEGLKDDSEGYDLEAVIKGIQDYSKGVIPKKDISKVLNEKTLKDYEKRLFALEAEKNLKLSEQYLSSISQKKTVQTLEEGTLYYEILDASNTSKPLTEDDSIVAQYTLFDMNNRSLFSSEEEDTAPPSFALCDLLPSLSKAMVGMHVQERRKIYVHPRLAYGLFGHLPPNSVLIMEVKLLKIIPPSSSDTSLR